MKYLRKFNESLSMEKQILIMMSNAILDVLEPVLEKLPEDARKMGMSTAEYFASKDLDASIDKLEGLKLQAEGIPELEETCKRIEDLVNRAYDLKNE